jgi:hypothetical protein
MQYQTRQGQFKLELQNCSGKLKTGKLFTTRSLVAQTDQDVFRNSFVVLK